MMSDEAQINVFPLALLQSKSIDICCREAIKVFNVAESDVYPHRPDAKGTKARKDAAEEEKKKGLLRSKVTHVPS